MTQKATQVSKHLLEEEKQKIERIKKETQELFKEDDIIQEAHKENEKKNLNTEKDAKGSEELLNDRER